MKGPNRGYKEAAAAFLLSGTSSPEPRAQTAQRRKVLIRVGRLRALTSTLLCMRAHLAGRHCKAHIPFQLRDSNRSYKEGKMYGTDSIP